VRKRDQESELENVDSNKRCRSLGLFPGGEEMVHVSESEKECPSWAEVVRMGGGGKL
jgi:hypothetical protein